jgi:hypothetical protein
MTLGELRDEYRATRIGPKILAEVSGVVRQVVRRYDPEVYAGSASWDDGEEDVVQSVVEDLLLREAQLDYLMATALRLEDFRNLLRFQVRRYMARTRRRSVIDNLLDRAKELLREPPFETDGSGESIRYRLSGSSVERREATDEEILVAARSAAHVPRIPFAAHDRAPIVYSREALTTVVQAVASGLTTWLSLRDLARVLELVLTDWVASFLYELEGDIRPSAILRPDEEMMAKQASDQILEQCSDQQLLLLRDKLENIADQDIAQALGLSRPTVIARKRELFEVMQAALADLPEHVQSSAMDRVALHLAASSGGRRA